MRSESFIGEHVQSFNDHFSYKAITGLQSSSKVWYFYFPASSFLELESPPLQSLYGKEQPNMSFCYSEER